MIPMQPDTTAGGTRRTTFDTGSVHDSSAGHGRSHCDHRTDEEEKHVAVHCTVLAAADDQKRNELCRKPYVENNAPLLISYHTSMNISTYQIPYRLPIRYRSKHILILDFYIMRRIGMGNSLLGQQLGLRIRELRLERGWSQKMLADRLHINKSVISFYELGSRFPTYDVLLSIADVFHVTTDYLIKGGKTRQMDLSLLTVEEYNAVAAIVDALQKSHSGE